MLTTVATVDVAPPASSIPAPGEAPMPAANAAALFRENATGERGSLPAIRFEDRVWTHAEFYAESARWAQLFLARCPENRARHVGVLLDNVPEYLFALAGAALSGATVVGINPTRRGEQLRRDIAHTDVAIIVTEPRYESLLDPIVGDLALASPVLVLGTSLDHALGD